MLDNSMIDLLSGGSSFAIGFMKWIIGKTFSHREDKLKYKMARNTSYFKDVQIARQANSGGFAWTRRLISVFIVFVIVGGVWMSAVKGIPVWVEVQQSQSLLGHLFGHSPHITWQKMNGFVIIHPFIQIMYMIVGFYFGSQGIK